MTAAPTAGATSGPSPAETQPDAVHDPLLLAQLDLATEWRFWCLMTHRDERVFAGRAGALRIFGTTMVRIDVPVGAATVTFGLHSDMVADWVICTEREAREAAAIIGLPERPVRPHVIGGDDEPF